MEQIPLFKEKAKHQPGLIFSGARPKKGRRITWREIPFHRNPGFYRGRIVSGGEKRIQAIITHTPTGYDLGWHRFVMPTEIVKIKR